MIQTIGRRRNCGVGRQCVVMEVVILKARAQLNRLVPGREGAEAVEKPVGGESRVRGATRAAAGRARSMAAAPGAPPAPSAASWLNASLAYNASRLNLSLDTEFDLLNANATDEHDNHWFCAKWTSAQQDLFQAANLCFAIAFLAPKSFKQSILVLRALAAAGAVLMAMWAGAEVCAPDVLVWSLALVFVNSIHTVFLIIRFLPPALSLELTELYLKLFKPLKVNKKHFQELTREARVVRLEPGEAYAVEEVTPADERLSILLKGKMRVSCDETHLHFIQPYQFVDSPEWEANREQSDDVFQVTVIAEEVCTCICWPRMRLERVLRHRPALKVVLDCLIGKDITHKLYSVSEGLGAGAGNDRDALPSHLTRSASVDAVHEGTRGRLRSVAWRARASTHKATSYWAPVTARQFLRQSPFSRSMTQPPRLLQQASSASLQPPALRRSPPRRATSFRRGREVKFAEAPTTPEPAV
ncbi:blood vessel epicardial substance-like [Pectinophora gossypiella]|uniref:blood vessel epicardial substance-like n=1 Tax=Pectinophora gossypiella TaxID=13191 RepID=UPI00214E25BA|nr:blood vessel epicardial substance-like [Pectinophora gossypiella]